MPHAKSVRRSARRGRGAAPERSRPAAARPDLRAPAWSVALLAALLLPAAAGAQAARPDTGRVHALDELVVSVTRTGQTLRDVPANVTVLNSAAVRASPAQTTADLLRIIPGFTLRDYQSTISAHPTRQAPSLRGLGGGTSASRTLVLVDGVPVADPFAGFVYWSGIPLEFVDRIEVVRGGGSGIWGNRAVGGIIHILTEAPRTSGIRATFQGGNLETVRGDVAATYRGERLGIAVLGEHFETDGYVQTRPDLVTAIDEASGTRHRMGYAKAEYALSPAVMVHASVSYLDEARRWGSALRRANVELGTAKAGARVALAGGNELALTVFGSDQTSNSTFTTEAVDRSTEEPSLDQFDVPAQSKGAGLQWSNRSLGAHELTAGADVFDVDGQVNEDFRLIGGVFTQRRRVGGQQLLGGVYAQDHVRVTPGLRVLASARYDVAKHSDGFRRETNRQSNAVLIDTAYASETQTTVNLSLGARLAVTDRLALRGSAYRAYRAPTLNELYKPFREAGNVLTEGNADLSEERMLGVELGLDYTFSEAALLRLTGFWGRMHDAIVEVTVSEAGGTGRVLAPCGFVPAGGVCRQRRNLDEFRSAGVEAELELHPAHAWTMWATYLWNPTEIVSAPTNPQLEGKQSTRSPRHSLNGGVRWIDPAIANLGLTGRWVGRRFEDDLNTLELEPFFVLDAQVSRSLNRHWELFAAGENLTDAEFDVTRATSGLVRVGAPRTVRAGVRVTL